jgi:hypothetical protein
MPGQRVCDLAAPLKEVELLNSPFLIMGQRTRRRLATTKTDCCPGTDVMILKKYFRRKNRRKIGVFCSKQS